MNFFIPVYETLTQRCLTTIQCHELLKCTKTIAGGGYSVKSRSRTIRHCTEMGTSCPNKNSTANSERQAAPVCQSKMTEFTAYNHQHLSYDQILH